jgi:hypothetical protein
MVVLTVASGFAALIGALQQELKGNKREIKLVLPFRGIEVRIWIRGSVPLTNGS